MRSDDDVTPLAPIDDITPRDEDACARPAIPPDSMEDFQKAIWGEETVPDRLRIPPATPD